MSAAPLFVPSRPITRSFTLKRRTQLRESPRRSKRPVTSAARSNKKLTTQLVDDLKIRLEDVADASYKPWIESYLRNELPCRGVKLPAVQKTVKAWVREHDLHSQSSAASDATLNRQLIRALFESPFSEDKLAATVYSGITVTSSPSHHRDLISLFDELFAEDLIRTWGTVDSFCARVLAKMIKNYDDEYALRLSSWRNAENLWKARCSIVTFVPFAKDEKFRDLIWENSSVVVQRPERFAKTSVGWILREVARYDEEFMTSFVGQFKQFMSLEAVRNATKHCAVEKKKKYVQMVKESNCTGKSS
ncbi:DNA alkylation repair enzyme [Gracilaria domingensis]|nr:DNA alkylation repair enzyme [Gracilaria domingensis]